MSVEDTILDRVRRLPPGKKEDVLRYAEQLMEPPRSRRVPYRDRSREIQWLRENEDKYPHCWVAIEGDQLIAADRDADKVFAAVDAAGIEVPFVIHIVPPNPLPFGGW